MSNKYQSQTPVRIRMVTSRYEVAESLFETILRSALGPHGFPPAEEDTAPVSPEEESLMGIVRDEESQSGYYVKPRDMSLDRSAQVDNDVVEGEGIDRLELFTEGLLIYSPDGPDAQISLTYDESELTGMDGAHSVITYHSSEPDLIHLVRSGSVTTAMTFKPHHRTVCVYQTPYMPFQVGIHCLVVKNQLLNEGRLVLDYIVEIRGAQAERCHMELELL